MAELKKYTLEEVALHNKAGDCWSIINGKVLDLSKFATEHPGGEEVLLEQSGKDGTEAFDDVGHSKEARDMADKMIIGYVDAGETKAAAAKPTTLKPIRATQQQQGPNPLVYLAPLAIIIAIVYTTYF